MIAYKEANLKAKAINAKATHWKEIGLIDEQTHSAIKAQYHAAPFSPSYIVRALFFIAVYIGSSFLLGPFMFAFSETMNLWRVTSFLLGLVLWYVTDQVIIKGRNHYKSGVTEAGLFASIFLLQLPLLDYMEDHFTASIFVGLLISLVFFLR